MAERIQRRRASGISLAMLLIIFSLSLFLVILANVSWTIIPASIFLTLGIVNIIYGVLHKGPEPLEYYFGPKQSSYSLGWGIILVFIGILILNIFVIGGISILVLFAILVFLIGIIGLFSFMKGGSGRRE